MDLGLYLKKSNILLKDMAKAIPCSTGALSNYVHKRREPKRWIRNRIVEYTHGLVAHEDLLLK